MTVKSFFAKYIHEGKCLPQEAACLINGLNPEESMMHEEEPEYDEINQSHTAYIRMLDEKLQHIVEVLCDGSAKWWLYRNKNIFEHIDKAIKNNIPVLLEVINTIREFTSNYLPADYLNFKCQYPYINRALESAGNSQNQNLLTSEAKYIRWQSVASQIYSNNPKLKKRQIAKEVLNKLSKEAAEFVMKENGELNDVSAIERKLSMRCIKKSIINK
jgi:hypothetical protein